MDQLIQFGLYLKGRLPTNQNLRDKGLGDRKYHLITYTTGNNDVAINMEHKLSDGSWNIISQIYKENSASAIVQMNGKEIDSQELKVVHQPVGGCLIFFIKRR